MILGAQNYTSEHTKEQIKLGASQPISALTELTSLSHNDVFPITDTANAQTKKLKWGTATATLKTLFDTKYTALFTDSAGLASILSDETGSSGGFVRAGSPTLDTVTITTSANITAPTFDVAGTDATGDIWYRNSGGLFTRLAIGATDDYLRVSGGLPDWQATSTIFPSQTGKSGSFLATDGTNILWGTAANAADYFSTTTTGTWTKPTLVNASSSVLVECWGGGGGGGSRSGSASGGGGGGGYIYKMFKASDLTSTVAITIGSGGAANTAGGNTTFGSYLTAYGGGGGVNNNTGAGGGGGGMTAGASGSAANGGAGGSPVGGAGGAGAGTGNDGFGGAGGAGNGSGGDAAYGGAGGSSSDGGVAGNSIYGGGGGGGTNGTSGSDTGGTSVFGGAGGNGNHSGVGSNGSVPGGGGGAGTTGGTGGGGKCNVITYN